MAKKHKSAQQIKAEIEALKAELKQLEAKEAQRLGKLALEAGLGSISANDADLVLAMRDVAARFQSAQF